MHVSCADKPDCGHTYQPPSGNRERLLASSVRKQAKALLNSYRKAPFLYEKEVEGKRKILSDKERKRIESMAEKDVETACGSAP